MRFAIHNVLFMSFAAWTTTGCVGEAASPGGLQAAGQALQNKGVYYLEATGTAENPAFTFYDQNKGVVGEGQSSQNPPQTEIQWRGSRWESAGGAFSENGRAVGSDGARAAERDTALTVFELSLDEAFPVTDQIQTSSCVLVACSRPAHRCMGACTGFVCSRTDGGVGTCRPPNGDPARPRPTPAP